MIKVTIKSRLCNALLFIFPFFNGSTSVPPLSEDEDEQTALTTTTTTTTTTAAPVPEDGSGMDGHFVYYFSCFLFAIIFLPITRVHV